jgi:predicted phosphohydrolase
MRIALESLAMARIFALADLHLSLGSDKPMEIFGELWKDHPGRMAAAWDERVGPEDHVLLPGDLSWARDLDQAAPDLAWIGRRPGRKLLLRGNHDSWWSGPAKVRRVLPDGCELLQNSATRIGNWVVVGSRGWTAPDDPASSPADARVFARELERLKLSVADADRRFGRAAPRLAMLHYPPWLDGCDPTAVVPVLIEAGVSVCVYGHLHGADHRLAVTGPREGIEFFFVAADAVGFAPVPIVRLEEGEEGSA